LTIAMSITIGALVVAMIAVMALFVFHAAWSMWLFGAAILVGFGSHVWLMLGVLREKPAP
jgi:hypothetical protein